jgi:hypothetical protein
MKNTTKNSRRNFLKSACALGIGCCAIGISRINALGADYLKDEVPDPEKLNYCGYTCPADCEMYIASIDNDIEKKKLAYEHWKIKEHYNIDFDADKIFCFQCKNTEKADGVIIKNCQVRKCAIEKGLKCCIECNNLSQCDKELWKTFPDFYKSVIEMQKKYLASK